MTDEQLREYLPSYDDQVAVFGYCRQKEQEPSSRESKIFDGLKGKLIRNKANYVPFHTESNSGMECSSLLDDFLPLTEEFLFEGPSHDLCKAEWESVGWIITFDWQKEAPPHKTCTCTSGASCSWCCGEWYCGLLSQVCVGDWASGLWILPYRFWRYWHGRIVGNHGYSQLSQASNSRLTLNKSSESLLTKNWFKSQLLG